MARHPCPRCGFESSRERWWDRHPVAAVLFALPAGYTLAGVPVVHGFGNDRCVRVLGRPAAAAAGGDRGPGRPRTPGADCGPAEMAVAVARRAQPANHAAPAGGPLVGHGTYEAECVEIREAAGNQNNGAMTSIEHTWTNRQPTVLEAIVTTGDGLRVAWTMAHRGKHARAPDNSIRGGRQRRGPRPTRKDSGPEDLGSIGCLAVLKIAIAALGSADGHALYS